MVGISTGLCRNLPRLIPGEIILIHEDSHKLCHRYRRMGVVELEGNLLIELSDVSVLTHILGNCLLNGSGNKEVLLF